MPISGAFMLTSISILFAILPFYGKCGFQDEFQGKNTKVASYSGEREFLVYLQK